MKRLETIFLILLLLLVGFFSFGAKMYVHDSPPLNSEIENIYHDSGTSKKRIATLEEGIQVKVGSFTCPGSTGNYSVTGVGFKPRYVEFTMMRTIANSARSGIGWMDYNGNQGSSAWASDGTNANTEYSVASCLLVINDVGTTVIQSAYVSMNSDGFTKNFTTVDTTYKILWKAVR